MKSSRKVSVGLGLWALVAAMVVQAEPTQVPLTSRAAAPPPPNVMVTIDDSGSMLSDAMPEGSFVVNKVTVPGLITGKWIAGFPSDPRKGNNYQDGTATGLNSGETVFQRQFRSPQVNSIWYDPKTTYLPWMGPNGVRMTAYPANMAPWDPVIATTTYDLTKTVSPNITWCTATNSCAASGKTFNPAQYYILTDGADPTKMDSYTRYNLNDTTVTTYPKSASRTDCGSAVVTVCARDQELQNFSNWFTYYRMRESLTKAAVSETLFNFTDKIRVGWGQINPSNAKKTKLTVVQQGIQPLDSAWLKSVLTNVQNISSYPSTPLRTAMDTVGKYFSKALSDADNPWLTSPGDTQSSDHETNSGALSCRRSVNVLMTDGYYNDRYSSAGDQDGVNGPDYASDNPDGYTPTGYVVSRPFNDAPSTYKDTLADVATKYYVNDLQSGIANKVAPVDGDIAFWQHLTQYTVGLGVKGTLDSSTAAKKLETIKAIKAGSQSWPDPTKGSPQKIDDMWHAAVNTGGDFYSVRNVSELSTALNDAFGRAVGAEAAEAGVAVSANVLLTAGLKFVPKYKAGSWNGDLEAYSLGTDGVAATTATWKASTAGNVPAADKRHLYTWNSTGKVVESFDWASMATSGNGLLVGSEILTNYIRGDSTNEGVGNDFRSRGGKVLGDFIDSPPVYVKDLVDLGYGAVDKSYSSHLASKQGRTKSVVFLGGNAGILHAFDGATGAELFGYLPQAGLANLKIIAEKDYGTPTNYHRYFVDGPMVETDAFIATRRSATEAWANLVVGSMGLGGTGFFALHLDTADPTLLDDKTVLWELSAANSTDIGYVMGEISVGKVKGGGWKAFVGNGVDSSSGKAALLVVDLSKGTIDQTLVVDSAGGNGLVGVTLVRDATTDVVAAYGGDLKGNLWRFDFAGGTGAVGFSGKPLFNAQMAGVPQPITVAPQVVNNTSGAGRIVIFGPGKLLATAAADDTSVQTVYGVLDATPDGVSSVTRASPFAAVTDGRSSMAPRYTTQTAKVTNGGKSYFDVTGAPVDWTTQLGWYMDLPFAGQRVVYPVMVLLNDYVFIQSMVPSAAAATCETKVGAGYNYALIARSGTQPTAPVFDTNGDNKIDDSDEVAAGVSTRADGVDKVVADAKVADLYYDVNTSESNKMKLKCLKCGVGGGSIRERIWRQILNPPTP